MKHEIDYAVVIRNFIEPKLGHFGFRYCEEKSHPPTGVYEFTRGYWGASQSVIISRIEYDRDDLEQALKGGDSPTEVPKQLLPIKDLGFRLWLSNKFIRAVLSHNGGSISIRHDGVGVGRSFVPFPTHNNYSSVLGGREIERLTEWWEFTDQATLIHVLNRIYERIVDDGLEWFERQVADIRRYHEKLDSRRTAGKERRHRQK